MTCSLRHILPAALAFVALAASVPAARAAVYIPTKTADTADGACDPTDCSLREAVLAANANPGEDAILLHTGTYVLSLAGSDDLGATGDLDVQGDLVLIGDGAGRTVLDGNGIDRIFHVAGGVTFDVRDATLRNGRAPGSGGAILNNGHLILTRSVLSGNASSADGGAIASSGNGSSLSVSASTIASNTAQARGGGLALGGNVALANLTITGNQANSGGGLYVFSDAQATINNVTLALNTAALKGGGAFLENTAFIGIAPKVTNSILAGNVAPSDRDCSGALESSYNLITDPAGCVGPSEANHDRLGSAFPPKLGPLQEAGGPTPTHPLGSGSPAIDAGNPAAPGSGNGACEATDQRGAARPGGPRCDIGAFEVTSACVAGGNTLCLSGGRFKVTATWQANNTTGPAQGVTLTGDSGYFWFFDPGNVELTVKVLNACTFNNRYWFFASGLTNVRVDLTVLDTKTGATRTYTNPQGQTFRSILDTNAFNTCP